MEVTAKCRSKRDPCGEANQCVTKYNNNRSAIRQAPITDLDHYTDTNKATNLLTILARLSGSITKLKCILQQKGLQNRPFVQSIAMILRGEETLSAGTYPSWLFP